MSIQNEKMIKGKIFKTLSEVSEFMKSLEAKTKQTFTKRGSSKEKPKKSSVILQEGIEFYYINYQCKYGPKSHKSQSDDIRKVSSRNENCPAKVRFTVTKSGDGLKITSVNLKHKNHLDNETIPVPENRRLTGQKLVFAQTSITLQSNRAMLIKMLNEDGGRVNQKYLKNLEAKMKNGINSNSYEEVLNFLKSFDGIKIDILKSKNNLFEGLFFTTWDMRVSMQAWKEIVFVDGTYKLYNNGLILELFTVEDGNFLSEVVGIALVYSEDQETFNWLFNVFKKQHALRDNDIKYFMSDKNAAQRNSMKNSFPDTELLLCAFHSQKSFEEEINVLWKKHKLTDDRNISLSHLKKMIYAGNQKKYDILYEEMKLNVPACVLEYFEKSWHPIRKQWSLREENPSSFGNWTNNRNESLNAKIKAVTRKLSSFLSGIQDLFIWKEFHDNSNADKIAKQFGSKPTSKLPLDKDLKKYQAILMEKPFNIIFDEFQSSIYINNFEYLEETDNYKMKNSPTRKMSTITCNCEIFVCYELPCKHIFAVRRYENLCFFEKQLYNQRWTKDYCQKNHRIFKKNNDLGYTMNISVKASKPDTVSGRMEAIENIIAELATLGSFSCGNIFLKNINTIENILQNILKGKNIFIVESTINNESSNIGKITENMKHLEVKNNNNKPTRTCNERRNILLSELSRFKELSSKKSVWQRTMTILNRLEYYWRNSIDVQVLIKMTPQDKSEEFIEIVDKTPIKIRGRPKGFNNTTPIFKKNKNRK